MSQLTSTESTVKPIRPFSFLPLNKKINWNKVRALDLSKILRQNVPDKLLLSLDDISRGKLDDEDCDPLLLKTLKMLQYSSQYIVSSEEYLKEKSKIIESAIDKLCSEEKEYDKEIKTLKSTKRTLKNELKAYSSLEKKYIRILNQVDPVAALKYTEKPKKADESVRCFTTPKFSSNDILNSPLRSKVLQQEEHAVNDTVRIPPKTLSSIGKPLSFPRTDDEIIRSTTLPLPVTRASSNFAMSVDSLEGNTIGAVALRPEDSVFDDSLDMPRVMSTNDDTVMAESLNHTVKNNNGQFRHYDSEDNTVKSVHKQAEADVEPSVTIAPTVKPNSNAWRRASNWRNMNVEDSDEELERDEPVPPVATTTVRALSNAVSDSDDELSVSQSSNESQNRITDSVQSFHANESYDDAPNMQTVRFGNTVTHDSSDRSQDLSVSGNQEGKSADSTWVSKDFLPKSSGNPFYDEPSVNSDVLIGTVNFPNGQTYSGTLKTNDTDTVRVNMAEMSQLSGESTMMRSTEYSSEFESSRDVSPVNINYDSPRAEDFNSTINTVSAQQYAQREVEVKQPVKPAPSLMWLPGRASLELIEIGQALDVHVSAFRWSNSVQDLFPSTQNVQVTMHCQFMNILSASSKSFDINTNNFTGSLSITSFNSSISSYNDSQLIQANYSCNMNFEKRSALNLLSDEIAEEQENLRLSVITIWSGEGEAVYGVAEVMLYPMIENNCNIIRHEVDIVKQSGGEEILGSLVIDVRGYQLLMKCS